MKNEHDYNSDWLSALHRLHQSVQVAQFGMRWLYTLDIYRLLFGGDVWGERREVWHLTKLEWFADIVKEWRKRVDMEEDEHGSDGEVKTRLRWMKWMNRVCVRVRPCVRAPACLCVRLCVPVCLSLYTVSGVVFRLPASQKLPVCVYVST